MAFGLTVDRHKTAGLAWLAPEYRVVLKLPVNPQPEAGAPSDYFMACTLALLPDGVLVAAIAQGRKHPEHGNRLEGFAVCNSRDGGETWNKVCHLPFDSGEPVLVAREGRVYLVITPNRSGFERGGFPRAKEGRIWVSVSEDAGATWSKPVRVLSGAPFYTSGGQAALAERDGRLYFTLSERYGPLAAVCVDLRLGMLNPAAWRVSPLVEMPVPAELVHDRFSDGTLMRCLEGNVVPVNGRLIVIARAIFNRYGTSNMGAVFEILDDGGPDGLRLQFLKHTPIPGGQGKFYIVYDAPSRLYWMASNLPTNAQGWARSRAGAPLPREDRRLLTLWYSLDALNWIPAGWIARAEGWDQSFSYPVMLAAGDDLLVIARSGLYSGSNHDVDHATFHRIRGFRRLAAPLIPGEAERGEREEQL